MVVNVNRGVLCHTGPIDEDFHEELLEGLLGFTRTPKELHLILSTEGGDVNVAFAVYDILSDLVSRLTITVNGRCESAGTLILQAANTRVSTPNSTFLIHYGSQGGTSANEFEFDQQLHKRWVSIMRSHSAITLEEMFKIHRGETYLTPEQMLKLGLIDKIGPLSLGV